MAEVGELKISLGLDTIDFTQGMTNVDKRLNALNTEFRAITAGAGKFDNSLDSLRSKSDVLTRTFDTQQKKVEELKRRYEESKAKSGEASAETLKLASSYNRAVAAMKNTENQLNQVNGKIEEQTNRWKNLSNRLNETGTRMQDTGERFRNVGQNLSTYVTLPIVGAGAALGKMAMDFESSAGRIEARLGLTSKEAGNLSKVAESVWKDAFGENVREAGDAVTTVRTNLGNLSNKELKQASESAFMLSETFNADINESTKTASSLIKNFGIDSEKAFDIITTGFQQGGDFSGELLDTLNEYSVQFSSIGLSAEQFLSILVSGTKAGAFNLDKVGDAVKEFNIRAQDGSKTTAEGFKAIGLNAQQMGSAIAKGGDEGQKAFVATISALATMKDPLKQNQAGVALFGTQWEDVRKKVIVAMADASKNISNVEGATKKATKAIQENFGDKARKVWRDFQKDLEPIGEDLLDIAEDVLPKAAKTIGNVTRAFSEMSPGAQKTVIAIAGIAAAAGPATIAIGAMSTGIGTTLKFVSPLITALGGSGLAASLTAVAGPVALVAAGLGATTAVIASGINDIKKSKEVNLDYAKSLVQQKQDLENLTEKYDALMSKNKLSNDELLRFRDIQSELKLTKSAEEIAKLKDEQAKLQEKSGLTNKELSDMLGYNDKIIKTAPDVDRVYSERGNAIISNKDALEQVNGKLRDNIALELENQRIKAESKLNENIQNYITALDELKTKEAERDAAVKERNETEQNIARLKVEAQNQINAGKDSEAQKTIDEIAQAQILLNQQNQKVINLAGEVGEKQKSVNKTQEEIEKTQALYDQMINLQLAQVGINAKGAEGIAQLDDAIKKTQARIDELNKAKQSQGGLNAEQQKELTHLQTALGKYQTTKGEIQKIQGEQAQVNQKIKDGTTNAQGMNKELGKDVNKNVNIDDKGKADDLNTKVKEAVTKKVTLQAIWTGVSKAVITALSHFATGTKYAPGGPSIVGEAGRELTYLPGKGLALVNGPTLLNLPRGAKVVPNRDTEKILRNWNIPKLANGGLTIKEGWAIAGERGREIVDLRGASTSPLTSSNESKQPIVIQMVTPDDRLMAEWLVDSITDLQEFKTNRFKVFSRRG